MCVDGPKWQFSEGSLLCVEGVWQWMWTYDKEIKIFILYALCPSHYNFYKDETVM